MRNTFTAKTVAIITYNGKAAISIQLSDSDVITHEAKQVCLPRENNYVLDQYGNRLFIQEKIVKSNGLILTSEFSLKKYETGEMYHNGGLLVAGQTFTIVNEYGQVEDRLQNFSSTKEEIVINELAIASLKETLRQLNRPAQTMYTQYAVKSLEETIFRLEQRQKEIQLFF